MAVICDVIATLWPGAMLRITYCTYIFGLRNKLELIRIVGAVPGINITYSPTLEINIFNPFYTPILFYVENAPFNQVILFPLFLNVIILCHCIFQMVSFVFNLSLCLNLINKPDILDSWPRT